MTGAAVGEGELDAPELVCGYKGADIFCENVIEEYAPQFVNQKQLVRELRSGSLSN